jgi:hypothetical protein
MGFFKQAEHCDRAPARGITQGRRVDRTSDELVGICRGILADGAINVPEAKFVSGWIERNAECLDVFPFNHLIEHLHHALTRGVFDADDESDLLDTLSRFVGGEAAGEHGSQSASLSSALPLNDPAPAPIDLPSVFVVTGTFRFGPRPLVVSTIRGHGGEVATNVSKKVRYLVVGEIGSRDWMHSSYGRKIEHACELRAQGANLAVISEQHWAQFVRARGG